MTIPAQHNTMVTTVIHTMDTTHTKKELLQHFLTRRKDVNVKLILHLIIQIFNFETKRLFQLLINLFYKENCYRERVKFLVNYKFFYVYPKHLDHITKNLNNNHMFSYNAKNKQNNLINKIKRKLLNIEIADLHIWRSQINKQIEVKTKLLSQIVDNDILQFFIEYYKTKLEFIIVPLKSKLKNKFHSIYSKKYNKPLDIDRYNDENFVKVNAHHNNTQVIEPSNNTCDKWCVNVADVELPPYVIDVLKLGEKFNFNNRFDNLLTLQYLKNFEMFLNKNIDDDSSKKLRGTFLTHIKRFYNKELSQDSYFDKKFKIDLKKTKDFIKHNPQLLITRADKGNTTVIIKKK